VDLRKSDSAIWNFVIPFKFFASEAFLHDDCVSMSDLGSEGFGDLLACIRNSKIPLQNNIHFVVILHECMFSICYLNTFSCNC
jgi:hypothetical protein